MEVEKKEEDECPVDAKADLKAAKVYKKNDLYFDTCMTKFDVKKGYYGVANFYVVQLLFDEVKNIYILFTRWGRVGDYNGGQFQRTPFNTEYEGMEEFKKVFRQKCGWKWDDIQNY